MFIFGIIIALFVIIACVMQVFDRTWEPESFDVPITNRDYIDNEARILDLKMRVRTPAALIIVAAIEMRIAMAKRMQEERLVVSAINAWRVRLEHKHGVAHSDALRYWA